MRPEEIPDGPPGGDEIAAEVKGIHTGQAGGTSGMRKEHLKAWLREAKSEKDPITKRWETVVSITNMVFQ